MNDHKHKTIYFITGASGVGKTSLMESLKKKYQNKGWAFLHFDSIGVPSMEEMIKEFGSPSGWQETKTYEWTDKIINEYDNEKVFLEGQVNLKFIYSALKNYHFEDFKIVLLDCTEHEMAYRLIQKRRQPELLPDDMSNWLLYLRNQAIELHIPIIDTSKLSEQAVLIQYEKEMGL